MNEQEFYMALKTILQTDADIGADTSLPELEEWDSIAFTMVITFFDKHFARHITFNDLGKCFSPRDIIKLADGAIA